MVHGLLALVWMSGSILIIHPELATTLAGIFGITRGVDLVVYLFIVLSFYYAIIMYYRLCDIRKHITLIVRYIAIAEHQIPVENKQVESGENHARPGYEDQLKA